MTFVNFYEVLEVQAQATEEMITSAYRKLALRYHPDKSGEDGVEKFLLVHKAYKVLCDPLLRKEYDEKIERHMTISVDMKMSDERMQLYERLQKKKSAPDVSEKKHSTTSSSTERTNEARYVPRAKAPVDFEEYERIVLERMRAV